MEHYEVVRKLKQPKSMDCWATAFAILFSWKRLDNSSSIKDILGNFGEPYVTLYQTNAGISPSDEEKLYQEAGLMVIKGQNPEIGYWYELLKKHGPLSITVDANPPKNYIHALVINGIRGEGSASNTTITYVDPADGIEHNESFTNFLKLYEGSATWPLQIIYWPKR